ncbi:MAG: sensor histidine kinase, partial [Peptococcales bacterium]
QLSSIVLEKFELEKVNEKLLVSQEQNRIANEIHDSALQRLFGLSCGIYTLMKKLDSLAVIQIEEELILMQRSINNILKELRSIIYGLSWKKDGKNNFIEELKNYIEETKRLNNIDISLNIIGDDELLSCLQKKAIYRIISEGISNAIHHGQADKVEVILRIENNITILQVIDNGIGFELNQLDKDREQGLGLKNIEYLVNSLQGFIDLQSMPRKGTKLLINFPNKSLSISEEEVV